MQALLQDLRERIVAAYEAGEGSYVVISARFAVGPTVVGKLVRQKRELGTLENQMHRRGRKPAVSGQKEVELREHLKNHPDATVLERREALGLQCSEKTLWQTLCKMGWRFKKVVTRRRARSSRRCLKTQGLARHPEGSRPRTPCFPG